MNWRNRQRERIVSHSIPLTEHEPSYSLNRQIERARSEMGEARWAELQREWPA